MMFCLLFWLLVLSAPVAAQPNASRFWYFGNTAGLDFSTTPPTVLTNSAMNAFEGAATIADASGALLFYTNGNLVWNKNHVPMPSGNGLNGDGAATQSSIIVPAPANNGIYYIFTVDTNGGPRGLCYSQVDMSLNGGNGDVTVKNIPLQTPVSEKLTAVRHANGVDAWVVVHGWNSDAFYAYRVTPAGVNTTPVISNAGSTHGGLFFNSHGYMKSSPQADKLALAIRGDRKVEVFDFNNITGQISNPVSKTYPVQVYGVEFSPNGELLYVSTMNNPGEIRQLNLTLGSPAAIAGSDQLVGSIPGFLGALQMASNKKIYIAEYMSTSLSVIEFPDLPGSACAVNAGTVFLGGKTSMYGLPNFLQSFFIVADFTYADTCEGAPTQFNTVFTNPDSVRWNFGDPASGAANVSTQINPTHTFTTDAAYTVQLIVYFGLLTDTVKKTIQVLPRPNPSLGNDTILGCVGNQVILDPGNFPVANYLWSDNSTGPTLTVSATGTYWVEVEENSCKASDTAVVILNNFPVVDLGASQTICEGDPLILDAGNPGAAYLWQDGSTAQTYSVTTTGLYAVTVSVGPCSDDDNVLITVTPRPNAALGPDTTLCKGTPLFLDATNPGASYIWQDGSTNSFLFAEDAGTYAVIVTVGQCTASDTVVIDQQEQPQVFLGEDSVLCAGQLIQLRAFNYGATYRWQDGSADSVYFPTITGQYYVTVENQCGLDADSINVTFNVCNCLVYIPNAFTPNRDTKNEVFNYEVNCTDFTGSLEIYNRFGQLLFASENPEIGWDGLHEGAEAPAGIYVYLLQYSGFDNGKFDKVKKRGSFLLLR